MEKVFSVQSQDFFLLKTGCDFKQPQYPLLALLDKKKKVSFSYIYLFNFKKRKYGVITTKWIDNRKLKTQWSLNSILEIKRIDEDFIGFKR